MIINRLRAWREQISHECAELLRTRDSATERIMVLDGVAQEIDKLIEEAEGASGPGPAVAVEGRKPRRNLAVAAEKTTRSLLEANHIAPTAQDVAAAMTLVVGSQVTESVAKRTLAGLCHRGRVIEAADDRYWPADKYIAPTPQQAAAAE